CTTPTSPPWTGSTATQPARCRPHPRPTPPADRRTAHPRIVLFVVNPAGMGFGDVKLAAVVGAALGWYGWPVLLAGAFAGLLLGAVYGVGLVLLRRADRRTAVPFGPFMLAGALIGVCLGASAA
ncbi:hypothetical protein C0036_22080, partial [Streptomyces sp. DJ]